MKRIMKGLDKFISYHEALKRIDLKLNIEKEEIKIEDSLNRIAAVDIISNNFLPEKNKSAVDGYAIISDDTISASEENPARLKIKHSIRPGESPGSISDGECVEIYTGACIPINANAVVKVEDTKNINDLLFVYRYVQAGKNIFKIGEDISPGFNIINKNSFIGPQHISAMFSINIDKIIVYKKIRICIINTGDEVYYGSIRNSTGYLLKFFYSLPYINVKDPIVCRDNDKEIENAINENINKCDIMIITGGSSLGRYDLTTDILSKLGKCIFSGVAIKPGRTVSLFNLNNIPVISCSGLPVAALLSSYFIISKIMKNTFNINIEKPVFGRISTNVSNSIGFTKFQICRAYISNGNLLIEPLKTTGSGLISSIINGNSFIILDDNIEGIEKDSMVKAYMIGDMKWE